MKVLLVGSGGREHAIAWKLSESKRVEKIYATPGNAGIAEVADCVDISVMDFDSLISFAKEKEIDFVVVAPDDPLVAGAVNRFEEEGFRCFGPRAEAAIIEGSKAFSKDLMKKYRIPTASYEVFTEKEGALRYLENAKFPIVLKADGLALGKGVLICEDFEAAKEGVKSIMEDKKFGSAGNTLVIEEFMTGVEVSVLCFCDGETILPMTSAMDFKRAKDEDEGLNTGGMGNISPSPYYTKEVSDFCMEKIYKPTMAAMKAEGRAFKGVLFVGLMLTEEGPKVLEYNARFGDPETQVVLPRMKSDLLEMMEACVDGGLSEVSLEFEENACVCVVLASEGYPLAYEKEKEVEIEGKFGKEGYFLFHAGTKRKEGKLLTNGGRVFGVSAVAPTLKEARERAYRATEWVKFSNKYMRKDIGKKAAEM